MVSELQEAVEAYLEVSRAIRDSNKFSIADDKGAKYDLPIEYNDNIKDSLVLHYLDKVRSKAREIENVI